MQLFIGNQNYSSWSLRAWLIFAQQNIPVEVVKLQLFSEEFYQRLADLSPTAKVPALQDEDLAVWDSLAILEYVNEAYLLGKAWPQNLGERAQARAVACEMHSGFMALRNELPMNCRATRRVDLSEAAQQDIQRIDTLWQRQMQQYPEQWLFGEWSIADAMFAPVALRFKTYQISLSEAAQRYQKRVIESEAVQRWLHEAAQENEIIEQDEAGEAV